MDAFIAHHLKGVSRTYAILIPRLPRALGEPVGLAYLLMRVIDTAEDAPDLSVEQRHGYLAALDGTLASGGEFPAELVQPIGALPAEQKLMQEVPEVLSRIGRLDSAYGEAIRTCARRMIAGVAEFARRSAQRGLPYPAIRDAEELRAYCYYVAGVVGEMLCRMMAHYLKLPQLETLSALAVELGVGLQMVNILKDALQDSCQGRRYLPTPVGDEVSHAEIYKAVLAEARTSLQKGVEFVLALPAQAASLRSFCGLQIVWGALTLARAERDPAHAKISRPTVRSSIARLTRLAADDEALRRWLGRLLRTPHPAPG